MGKGKSGAPKVTGFVTQPHHHLPRLRKSLVILVIGAVLAYLGFFLISNDLPDTSSRRAQIGLQGIPAAFGGALLIFGAIGAVTALAGLKRTGAEAIDMIVEKSGLVVRGERRIPWESIESATSIQYKNEAKVKLLWDPSQLHRSLLLKVAGDAGLPGRQAADGGHEVKIDLVRYPEADYSKYFKMAMGQFSLHGIAVEQKTKWMQT
ncbi:hypothetical protein OF385_13880 [Glutamicibacter sp. JL.03c]|uniref:hypothetical protein n=1 Tax=Glutamicibacter sp. JL.03c TaxID=2984842 RepID=UPI0021F7C108|nr:hypothetical protein [Glutamicibacter sp. JL.03c]UYQ77095.1 hypothetical protein OF385_13880 [Glutamicibacter sp. JL.03c]